jgi:structure-specific recognition protein 1
VTQDDEEEIASEKRSNVGEKKKRAKKDSAAPKRNKSAYLYFAEAKRPELKATFSNETMGGLSKRVAEAWKQMSEEEKQVSKL